MLRLLATIAFASAIAAAESAPDPVGDMIGKGFAKDSALVVAKFDWNEDGKDDLLITSEKNLDINGRSGGLWDAWLSNPSGTYDQADGIVTSLRTLFVVRLPELGNVKAIVTYVPMGGGQAGITAHFLGRGPTVETRDLGTMNWNDPDRVAASDALEKRTFGSAEKVEAETVTASAGGK